MTWTFELNLDSVKANQQAKQLGSRPFRVKVTARTDAQWIDRSTWTTKMIGNTQGHGSYYFLRFISNHSRLEYPRTAVFL